MWKKIIITYFSPTIQKGHRCWEIYLVDKLTTNLNNIYLNNRSFNPPHWPLNNFSSTHFQNITNEMLWRIKHQIISNSKHQACNLICNHLNIYFITIEYFDFCKFLFYFCKLFWDHVLKEQITSFQHSLWQWNS